MDILLEHWHCILPIIAIGIGMFLMNRKDSKKEKDE
jgi:cadmium resistance protein CadD (predicted permease)